MRLLRKILASLEARLNQPRLSLWRTIYFNFRTMPFRTAIKFPVFIYGKIHLFILAGSVVFEKTSVRRGMVKIGKNLESFSAFDHSGFIQLASSDSRLIFEGPASISVNTKIRIIMGDLKFGKYAYVGSGVRIVCNGSYINIGDYSRIAFDSIIMNSSFHHVYNDNRKSISCATRPIEIGKLSWIGNRSSIMAGSCLKSHSIVTSNSLVNKNFAQIEGDYPMIGGVPAKVIMCGMHRVFSPQLEKEIIHWFRKYPNEKYYIIENFQDDFTEIEQEY